MAVHTFPSSLSNSHTHRITWSQWSPTSMVSSTPHRYLTSSSRPQKACRTGCRWSRWTSLWTSGAPRPPLGALLPRWSSRPRTGEARRGWACPLLARLWKSTHRLPRECSPSACHCPCLPWWPQPSPGTGSGAPGSCPSYSRSWCSRSPLCTPVTSSSRLWSPYPRKWKIQIVACKYL